MTWRLFTLDPPVCSHLLSAHFTMWQGSVRPEKKFDKIRTQKCFYHPHDASPLVASLRHTIFHSPQPPTQDWPLEPKTAARHTYDRRLTSRERDLLFTSMSAARPMVGGLGNLRIAVGGS